MSKKENNDRHAAPPTDARYNPILLKAQDTPSHYVPMLGDRCIATFKQAELRGGWVSLKNANLLGFMGEYLLDLKDLIPIHTVNLPDLCVRLDQIVWVTEVSG